MKLNKAKGLSVAAMLFKSGPAAAAATGLVSSGLADISGHDPWTWFIGGIGAAVVFVKKPATSRMDAITNSLISVLIAGLVAPIFSVWLFHWANLGEPNPYPAAFVLSAGWPWLVSAVAKKFQGAEVEVEVKSETKIDHVEEEAK